MLSIRKCKLFSLVDLQPFLHRAFQIIVQATCCSDKLHCCPKGYSCGEGGICNAESKFHSSLQGFRFG